MSRETEIELYTCLIILVVMAILMAWKLY